MRAGARRRRDEEGVADPPNEQDDGVGEAVARLHRRLHAASDSGWEKLFVNVPRTHPPLAPSPRTFPPAQGPSLRMQARSHIISAAQCAATAGSHVLIAALSRRVLDRDPEGRLDMEMLRSGMLIELQARHCQTWPARWSTRRRRNRRAPAVDQP